MRKGRLSVARLALGKWRRAQRVWTAVKPSASFLIPTAFALYNGFLGALHRSLWHGSICVYYLLLAVIRGSVLLANRKGQSLAPAQAARIERKTFLFSSVALLVLNLALITPVALMARMQRPVSMGLIPAIAVAAYTTYKVTLASIHYRRRNREEGLLAREERAINFIDALLSVVTLQNTLIMVNLEESGGGLPTLTALSSAAFLAGIIAVSIANLARGLKEGKCREKNAP